MSSYLGYDEAWLLEHKAIHTAREIHQQPELWRQLVGILADKKDEIDAFMQPLKAKRDLRIILTGAGTSAFAGDAVAPFIQNNNRFAVEAIASTDIVSNPEQYLDPARPTLVVSFARSGNSPESVAAVELASQVIPECYHLFLTCNGEGQLAQYADQEKSALCVLMPERSNDKSFAMTSSFTCMMMASLAVLGDDDTAAFGENVDTLATSCERHIQSWIGKIGQLTDLPYKRLVVLGNGGFAGLAREAALKSLELSAGKVMTAFDSSLGFRHGPKFIIDSSSLVIQFFSSDTYSRKYDIDLHNEMQADGQVLGQVALTAESFDADTVVELGSNGLDEQWLLFPYIVFTQMLALGKSLKLGLTPDNPCPTGEVNRVVQGVTIHTYNANNSN
ncbi:SIS domain-containing protein [Vibrio sp. JC009]|uniref:SIS domain-containing protein n=1 Tax=Vibrio sp. JC009 TaxID=2912314 RepID=UPI0023B14329|nr:SIS domain-containing protein [Vibrio sp. JC009]WED24950.1 SIS domain-containing protein [Vibrio sp. JC009]